MSNRVEIGQKTGIERQSGADRVGPRNVDASGGPTEFIGGDQEFGAISGAFPVLVPGLVFKISGGS